MSMIYGDPSLDFPTQQSGGLRVFGGQMGGFFPTPVITTPINNSAPLYIFGEESGTFSKPMNLTIKGGHPDMYAVAPLFIYNDFSEISDSVDLFIRGLGQSDGATPFNEDINLVLQRGPNAGIGLFLCNNNMGNVLPLFIDGHGFIETYLNEQPQVETVPSSSYGLYGFKVMRYDVQRMSNKAAGALCPPLFIRGDGGAVAGEIPLFISGLDPISINDQVTLVIPNVKGEPFKSVPLYTHGFNY